MTVSSIPAPQVVNNRPIPKFIFLEKSSVIDTHESFAKEGFAHLLEGLTDMSANHASQPYMQEKDFLINCKHKEMLSHLAMLVSKEYLCIPIEFDKLEIALRTAYADEYSLNKDKSLL